MSEPRDTRGDIEVLYTNYRSQQRVRKIRPLRMYFGTTPYHPEPQWLLDVVDLERDAMRTFAMAGILSWDIKEAES